MELLAQLAPQLVPTANLKTRYGARVARKSHHRRLCVCAATNAFTSHNYRPDARTISKGVNVYEFSPWLSRCNTTSLLLAKAAAIGMSIG